ncbi:aldehyde dehydrogenase family protein [Acidithrix ferrooxidans]|uniref:aldehyde dehydrogenase (NAD(+)) n=1 Tax=Acidithrix ferrooxidans TaxID=1280514 RepID=A0A0D8HI15_9ACTN|nr:aldehyde dehydrogenase family protein [Acidithrix ferrooxidans]KJF17635.1 3-succinoylsemialdehyde-pyridine dehydrogenase [Acidithrix ferrooxidans]
MIVRDSIYVDGSWIKSNATSTIDVINSTTEEVMATVPAGTAADVEKAVDAAKRAFKTWSKVSVDERSKYCTRIAEGLQARLDEISTIVTQEVGMVKNLSSLIQVGLPINSFSTAASIASSFDFEERSGNSTIVREPIGVVGCITPWNYPLHQIAAKVAYAIAAGCTVVLKPSEVAPLNAFLLAEIVDEVGLPAGVFNLVCGVGPIVGEAIASHPDVDMVSFTGSTRAGSRIAEICGSRIAKATLELGGKSANIILEDADLERAVADGVSKAFLNSGQTCSALTRMLVPRNKITEVEQIAAQTAEKMTVGDPFARNSRLGPLVSKSQWDRVQHYISIGIDEGATLVTGGLGKPDGLDTGFFVKPTIFSNVSSDMTIAQEEIFGPVLVIIPFDTEEEAIAIANDSNYGLAGGVWASTQERALSIARQIRTGQVEINGGAFNPNAPFGGYKKSGIGREFGRFGLDEFLLVKSIQE